MKLAVAVKLKPSIEQAQSLKNTLCRCNEACSWLAEQGFNAGIFRQYDMHKMAYYDLRKRFDLTAQAAVRCISKVADAFKINKKKAPVFRPLAAQPYDERIFRFMGDKVSLWTVDGRIKVPFVAGERQRELFSFRKGEADLAFKNGKWFLICVCDIPETDTFNPKDWIGVDLGIISLAVDSNGTKYTGEKVERKRSKLSRRRAGLQKNGSKAAKRRLRKLSGKQRRYQTHINHEISKALVKTAERTGCGIAMEDLTHIRKRVQAKRSQRARLHNWAFGQLRAFVTYKAKCSGVPVVFVDPAYTSQGCSSCGTIDKRNRPDQATFLCINCGHSESADLNAARNLRAMATVNRPLCSQALAA